MDDSSLEHLPALASDGRAKHAGMFAPGRSGNISGRPKVTPAERESRDLRIALELAVLKQATPKRIKTILEKLFALAEGGDVKAAKLIFDKIIPDAKPREADKDPGRTVVFRIENAMIATQQKNDEIRQLGHDVVDAPFDVIPNTETITTNE